MVEILFVCTSVLDHHFSIDPIVLDEKYHIQANIKLILIAVLNE